MIALCDDQDYPILSQHFWQAVKNGQCYYARVEKKTKGQKRFSMFMHRMIAKPPPGYDIDHINRNGLDNRRVNLRICTRQQNSANRMRSEKKSHSRFKGVTFHKSSGKWLAQITVGYEHHYLGVFRHEEDAAREYDREAVRLCGEFALTNAMLDLYEPILDNPS